MPSYDVIVIGGGINGLAAAGRLAKAGRKVIVLEKAAQPGGGAETREFHPGYRVSGLAHLLTQLDPRVDHDLDLARHGLRYAARTMASTAVAENGNHLVVQGGAVTGEIAPAEHQAWEQLHARLSRHAKALAPFKRMVPPQLEKSIRNESWKLAQLGLSMRRRGKEELRDLMRLMLINVADVLEDELRDDRLKGLVAFDTVLGGFMGPRSPNSLMLLLHNLSGSLPSLPSGGMGSVAAALEKAVRNHGVEIRAPATADAILTDLDRVSGVMLAGGEQLAAPIVLSAINPKTTLLNLVGPRSLDTDCVRRMNNIRMRASAVKLNVALTGKPDFRGADLRSRLIIAPSVNAVENAFNAVKYGGFSSEPVMEIVVPSAFEPEFAPPGHHVLSIVAQYAPTELRGGWENGRAALEAAILGTLERYAPGIRSMIAGTELLAPPDIEARYGMIGGNWHHGELAVEQMLFLRPAPGMSDYTTPITGLFLGGAGSHPGGGISGAAGWNAAGQIIARGGT